MSETETGNTLRDVIEANVEAAENGTLGQDVATDVAEDRQISTTDDKTERTRDESGRFAKKEVIPPEEVKEEVITPEEPKRPTTWKKEYLPIYDKMVNGIPLSKEEGKKLAEYTAFQREKEFATGVSTYRAEAQQAKQWTEAMAPFMPNLQQAGINPVTHVQNLARAHEVLALGSPEQKLQAFQKLAQDYGIPLAAVQQQSQGGVHPLVTQLMGQIQALQGQVQQVSGWRQQQEMQQVTNEIEAFKANTAEHPHYESVRTTMAQLLESGQAQDLKDAYEKAVWLTPEVRQAEIERLQSAATSPLVKQQAIQKARNAAVSPKSTSPGGSVANGSKDRRALLEAQFDSLVGSRV